jgi:hypothetical protein
MHCALLRHRDPGLPRLLSQISYQFGVSHFPFHYTFRQAAGLGTTPGQKFEYTVSTHDTRRRHPDFRPSICCIQESYKMLATSQKILQSQRNCSMLGKWTSIDVFSIPSSHQPTYAPNHLQKAFDPTRITSNPPRQVMLYLEALTTTSHAQAKVSRYTIQGDRQVAKKDKKTNADVCYPERPCTKPMPMLSSCPLFFRKAIVARK